MKGTLKWSPKFLFWPFKASWAHETIYGFHQRLGGNPYQGLFLCWVGRPGWWLSQEGKLLLQGWSKHPRGLEEEPPASAHCENRGWHPWRPEGESRFYLGGMQGMCNRNIREVGQELWCLPHCPNTACSPPAEQVGSEATRQTLSPMRHDLHTPALNNPGLLHCKNSLCSTDLEVSHFWLQVGAVQLRGCPLQNQRSYGSRPFHTCAAEIELSPLLSLWS